MSEKLKPCPQCKYELDTIDTGRGVELNGNIHSWTFKFCPNCGWNTMSAYQSEIDRLNKELTIARHSAFIAHNDIDDLQELNADLVKVLTVNCEICKKADIYTPEMCSECAVFPVVARAEGKGQ